jgi:predicted ATPase/DNA-binding SARP family transcriptional activator
LPAPLSTFVGRAAELAELASLIDQARLVSVTGLGGAGKSRLALALAERVAPRFPDGVWWVPLAEVTDPADVADAVADAVADGMRLPVAALVHQLRASQALLIFDNCEQLGDAVAELVEELLGGCAGLRVLTTSQRALGVAGEVTWAVPPLSTPAGPDIGPDTSGYESVRLFVDRARSVLPQFDVGDDNLAAIVAVCQRLEGIPLAIELAAARVKVLSVQQIAMRLDDTLRLLVGGSRTAMPRHRAMLATMDRSFALLREPERHLLAELSVFVGSFDLDAVEALHQPQGPDQVLDVLTELVDRSLVTVLPAGRFRYRLLEPVRQYATARLDERGGMAAARARHADYYVGLAERGEAGIAGGGQQTWLDRLDDERDNLRAAMRWCLRGGSAHGALRLSSALWRFCHLRGHAREGRTWLEDALDGSTDAPAPLRAKGLVAAGMLALLEGDHDVATARCRAGLAVYQELADGDGIAMASQALGSIALRRGDYAGARALYEEGRQTWTALSDENGIAHSLHHLGFAAWLDQDYDRAARLCAEAQLLFERLDDQRGRVWSLISLGTVALYRGDHPVATVLLTKGLALSRDAGYREGVGWSLNQLGTLALRRGEPAQADRLLRESLIEHQAVGDRWRTASVVDGLAGAAMAGGDPASAARLLAAADALRTAIGTPVPHAERADHDRTVAATMAALPPERFAELSAAGQAAALADTIDGTLPSGAPEADSPPSRPLVGVFVAPVELRIQALGAARVHLGPTMRESPAWTYAKPRELLYFLLSHADSTKDQIGAALWPWTSPTTLRNSFHTTLHHLRRALGDPTWITYRHGRYSFNRDRPYAWDVDVLNTGLAHIHSTEPTSLPHLVAAVQAYQGDFLADLPGEQWIDVRRTELRTAFEQVLLALGRRYTQAGQFAQAVETYERAITHDNLLEVAHRELIQCYASMGERARALRHYNKLVTLLDDQLGISPSAETRDLYAALRTVNGASVP